MGNITACCGHEIKEFNEGRDRYFVESLCDWEGVGLAIVSGFYCLDCCKKNRRWMYAKESTARKHLEKATVCELEL